MNSEDVLNEFREAGALWEGHFILASGLHSPIYLQKALVFREPKRMERLARAIAEGLKRSGHGPFDIVVSPAVGAIIPGYEVARVLGLPAIYCERNKENKFAFGRGFELEPGARVLMVEDIVTTGVSSRECIDAIRAAGGKPVAAACVIDRSGGSANLGVPFLPLARLDIPTYAEDKLPPDLAAIPAVKPGSRQKGIGR
jgi:orotate phosphoribosyltransferase